jgi:hypothetical protein
MVLIDLIIKNINKFYIISCSHIRPSDAAAVYYMEASMKDGFGLKYLYRFFNVPFLELQVCSHLQFITDSNPIDPYQFRVIKISSL